MREKEDSVALVSLGIADVERGKAGRLRRKRHEPDACGRNHDAAPSRSGSEEHCRNGREKSRRKYHARRAEAVQQRNEDQAPGRSAEQVGGIDDVDAIAQPRERERDDRAAAEERQGREHVDRKHEREVRRRVVQPHADADEAGQRD
jgi:hypothetical protein